MKLKKVLATILAAAMVLSTMSFSVFAEEADVWDGTSYSLDWLDAGDPEGTAGDEFHLNSAEDLAGLAYYVNTYASTNHIFAGDTIYLNVDVDLDNHDWAPIGTAVPGEKNRFYGSFDGQGHTISNLKIADGHYYAGLFGQIATYNYSQTFSNVTINNAVVVATDETESGKNKEAAGALIGRANGTVINNCHVTGEINISGDRFVGGLLGHSYAKISDCSVEASGTIHADTWQAGGLVGTHGATATYTSSVENCSVIGNGEDGLNVTSYYASVGGAIGAVSVSGVDSTTMEGITVANVSIAADSEDYGSGIAYVAVGYEATNSTIGNVSATLGNEEYVAADADVVGIAVALVGNSGYATLQEAIDAAKVNGDTVTLTTDLTIEAGNGGYSKAGIVQNGFDIDGNGHTLNVTGANDTWDCAIYTNGGTIKNLTIASGMRGVFTAGQTEDIILENVTIDGPIYTISADGASGVKWIIKNSTLNGWTSYTSGFEVVSFENCTFGEGSGYAYMRPYADTIYTGCDFTDDYSVDARADIEMTDCSIDGTPMTAEDVAELLGGSAQANIGSVYYDSINDAFAAAVDGDTITIFAGEYEGFDVPANKNNLTFVGETDADGNNLVTIKTLEDGITSHNGGIFVGSETTTFKNLNFTAGTTPGASSGWMSSSLGNTNGDTGMSSSLKNLTVENCNFTGSGAYQAIWTNQGNVTVKNSTITNYDTAVDTYGIHADQKMVIENTEIADVRNAFHTGEAEVGSQIVVTETTIDSDVIDIGGAAAVTITNSEISNAVVTTYTENNQMTISGTLLINSVINEEAKGTYNGVNIAEDYDAAIAAVAANNEIISTKLNISFEQVEAGLYNIVLNGEDDIYEFVGAELTFANTSTTIANEPMNYEILGISGATNAEKSIEKADTYALRLVDGAERMCGSDLVIGQVKFYGQGDINFTVSEGTVVTTEYGTNLGQYYTLDANTLTVDAITNGAVEEVTRTVVVNVAYKHALDGNYWTDNQITVTLKDGFGNVYDAEDLTNGVATINNVKLGRLTVTLEAPGFRRYVYNTTLTEGDSALVLNFWNDIKRDTVQSPLAEIEAGVSGKTNKNFVVGDIVMDYTVDEYDLAAVTSYYGMYELTDADKYIKYDLNRDGNIDIIDVHYVLHTLGN